jgi:hypothetical protein
MKERKDVKSYPSLQLACVFRAPIPLLQLPAPLVEEFLQFNKSLTALR